MGWIFEVLRADYDGLHNAYDPIPSLQLSTDTTPKNKMWV